MPNGPASPRQFRIQPQSSSRAMRSSMRSPGLLSFRQGATAKFSPPFSRKISAAPMAISSSVYRQSAEKAGVVTNRFRTPERARSAMVSAV